MWKRGINTKGAENFLTRSTHPPNNKRDNRRKKKAIVQYPQKNIPVLSKHEYIFALLNKVEDFLKRLIWQVLIYFKNKNKLITWRRLL